MWKVLRKRQMGFPEMGHIPHRWDESVLATQRKIVTLRHSNRNYSKSNRDENRHRE
jgi:hypothetical protein